MDWARNRAIVEARSEIIAYTDDDVVVDPNWVSALAAVFAQEPDVMAVTGLVVPYELETNAQTLFEKDHGFGRGFRRKWYRADTKKNRRIARTHGGIGKVGTGANMAYRRELFENIGFFDPALDVGTPTNGGGDIDMFFRVIKEGYTLLYEPSAMVRHVHRREDKDLRKQMFSWGTAFCCYLITNAVAYPHEVEGLLKLWLRWFWQRGLRRLLISFLRPARSNRRLILAEMWGLLVGVFCYCRARSVAKKVEQKFGPLPQSEVHLKYTLKKGMPERGSGFASRTIDVCQCPSALTDVVDYPVTRVFVTRANRPVGYVDIANEYGIISAARLVEAIVQEFSARLLPETDSYSANFTTEETPTILKLHYGWPQMFLSSARRNMLMMSTKRPEASDMAPAQS